MRLTRTIVFALIPFLFACKAKKNIPRTPAHCRLDYKSARTLTGLLKKNQLDYSSFSGKIKMTVMMEDKNTDFTIALRMKKDSVIWASISPALGIEVIRFSATKDSIKFIDRLHQRYFIGNYDTLSAMLKSDIDLEMVQSLLVGNSVEFYEDDERLRPGIDTCHYLLGTIRKRKLRKVIVRGKELKEPAQNIWMTDSTFKIDRILFREFESKREFDARFSDFRVPDQDQENASNQTMPYTHSYQIRSEKMIRVSMEYTKAGINKTQTYPFTVPEGYEKIGNK